LYKIAYYMNIGSRDGQEDCIFVDGRVFQESIFEKVSVKDIRKAKALFAVCDGMGGHAKGEWASRFVCEKLKTNLRKFEFSRDATGFLLEKIQNQIENEMVGNSGTTIAGVALERDRAEIFNVGDSRVYKITRTGMMCMSHDHSLVQSGVDRGDIPPDEAFAHPHKNVIEFGMGDVFRNEWAKGDKVSHIRADLFGADEYYLICTDGVNDVLMDDEMYDMLRVDPFGKLAGFVESLKRRMKDNFSFILIANPSRKGKADLK
jgi:serine/threonine protein phosphatase PrpC